MSIHQLRPDIKGIGQTILEFAQEHDVSIIDAAVHYAEVNQLEVELVGDLLASDPRLKEKIGIEAEQLHMLKGEDG